jgi:hypothetical protein
MANTRRLIKPEVKTAQASMQRGFTASIHLCKVHEVKNLLEPQLLQTIPQSAAGEYIILTGL